jgi:hypothetical protein
MFGSSDWIWVLAMLWLADGAAMYTNPVVQVNSPDPGVLGYETIPGSGKQSFVAVTSTGFNFTKDVSDGRLIIVAATAVPPSFPQPAHV